jgi:di/tricarboxylate transporter
MPWDQTLILMILFATLVLFIWGKWRYDLVALMALSACALGGLVSSDALFSGFGHPATITVAVVLTLSHGLSKSGAIEGVTNLIAPLSKHPTLHLTALVFIAAFLSMFMNNVGALALLMPVAIQSTLQANRPPAMVLMPLSFGSILGGLVTLIGTPPNIIISTYREETLGSPYQMFDFAPVGGAVAAAGLLFMILIGWRLVRVRKQGNDLELFDIESYLFEVRIPEEHALIGQPLKELKEALGEGNIKILILDHQGQNFSAVPDQHPFAAGDVLVLQGSHEAVDKMASKHKLELLGADSAKESLEHHDQSLVMEMAVAPTSRLVDRIASSVRFKHALGIDLIAVARHGRPIKQRLKHIRFRAGDVLLVHGEEAMVEEALSYLGCYPLAERQLDLGKRKFAWPTLLLFVAAIGLAVSGTFSLQISLGLAVICLLLTNIIPMRELYDAIDWPVIVLLGAMIPVGQALENTGTTTLLADQLLSLAGGLPTWGILAILLGVTMTMSDVLNNAATVILMAPIAKTLATTLGVNPDAFLMAVAIGASCAFLTPIGHQNNALVMGPGGYEFGDYWRVGLLLEVLILAVSIPMLLIIWPL